MRTAKLWLPTALAAAVVSAVGLTALPAAASAAGSHSPAAAARPAASPGPARSADLARLPERRALAAEPGSGITGDSGNGNGSGMAGDSRSGSDSGSGSGSATVTGTVLGVHGAPLPGACVTAIGKSGSFTGTARNNGRFVISGLPAGRYSLEYRDCAGPGRYFAQWSGDADLPGSASQIVMAAGRVRTLSPVTLHPTRPAALLPVKRPLLRNPAQAGGTSAAADGRISGVVTDQAGHPLKGICAFAFPIDGGGALAAGTSKTGAYTTGVLAPGSYQVQFSTGCNNSGNWLPQTYRNQTAEFSSQQPTPVTVTAGQTTTGIDAAMLLGGEISGTVTSRTGRKLTGICVTVSKMTRNTLDEIGTATSRGSYHAGSLFPGKYRVEFTTGCPNGRNFAPQWWPKAATFTKSAIVRVTSGKVDSRIDAVLRPGAQISGTVRLAGQRGKPGRPLRGICVDALGEGAMQDVEVQAATDRNGTYLVNGLGTGKYQMQFTAQGCGNNGNFVASVRRHAVTATAGKITTGIDGVLRRGGKISGVVRNAHGKRLSGICLQLQGGDGGAAGPQETNRNGSFAFTQLNASSYTLEFFGGCDNTGNFTPQWYHGESSSFTADPIKIGAGQARSNINAVMRPGGTVSGHVTDLAGKNLAGVCVTVTTPGEALFGSNIFVSIANTDSNGNYQIPDLALGLYEAAFFGGCGSAELAEQWYRSQPDFASAALISVRAGAPTTGIDAVMQPGGNITGVVTGKTGHRLSTACVTATDRQTGAQSDQGEQLTEDGGYRFTDLQPGTYSVEFSGCSAGTNFANQWYKGQASQSSATPVTVTGGHTTSGIGAVMTRGATIFGRVVTAAGKPVRNACVDAFDPATGGFGFGQTGKRGRYTVTSLNTGSYRMDFSLCAQGNSSLAGVIRQRQVRVTAPRAVTGIDATLRPGGSISGVVRGGKPKTRPEGSICIEAVSTARDGFGGFGFTGPGGRFVVRGLTAGVYQVFFDPSCQLGVENLVGQWYKNQSAQGRATPVRVRVAKTTAGIDATLATDGSISGSVTGPAPSSTALTGACVTAVPLAAGASQVIGVSEKGSYSLINVPPGRYRVEFGSGCGITGLATQWWRDAPTKEKATIINVTAGADTGGISAALGN